jgi:hypothetical protein
MADLMPVFTVGALCAVASAEIAKAKSIRERINMRGPHMTADAIEILNAIAFAHEDAASQLIADAQDQG